MILDIPSACSDIELLNLLSIIRGLLDLTCILIPAILIIFLIIDVIKTVSSAEVDTKKLFKNISKRIVAALVVFLIPYIISFIIGLVPNGTLAWADCYEYAKSDQIKEISVENADNKLEELEDAYSAYRENKTKANETRLNQKYEEARLAIKLITDKDIRKSYKSKLEKYK